MAFAHTNVNEGHELRNWAQKFGVKPDELKEAVKRVGECEGKGKGVRMVKGFAGVLGVVFLCALAGCSGMPQGQAGRSPCSTNPGGYDCQVEQYMKAR